MAEIPFEQLLLALESTRGTAITTPTHTMNVAGTLTPMRMRYRPREARGTLVSNYRHKTVRTGVDWEADGDADVNLLPVWLHMAVRGSGVSPATPGGGTNSRTWTFTRSATADNLASATLTWFDSTFNMLRAPYCMVDELVFENDATAEEVAKLTVKGKGQFPTSVTAPTLPASIAGDTLPGQMMQLWIDTSSAIGTTAVSGRLLKAKHTVSTGVTYKYADAGPTASLSFTRTGRIPTVGLKTELEFEVTDLNQYTQWAADSDLRVRVRHSGALIEGSLYNYVQFDQYGPWDALEWSSYEESNRTLKLTIETQYDSTLGSDFSVVVQNARTAL